jgi:hypothetical protein
MDPRGRRSTDGLADAWLKPDDRATDRPEIAVGHQRAE